MRESLASIRPEREGGNQKNRKQHMSLTVKEQSSYTPPPAGTHFARCYACIDLGIQPQPAGSKFKPGPKVMLMFELPHERVKYDDNGVERERPATISCEYTASLGKKAKLRKHLDAWRGRAFTEEELQGFSLTKVLGAPCCVSIIHAPKANGGISAKIEAVTAVPKGTPVPELHHKTISYDIEHGRNAVFQGLHEWIQNKIAQCAEWNMPATETHVDAEPEHIEGDEPF